MSIASCSKRPRQARGEAGRLGQRLLAAPAADDDRPEPGQLERRLPPEAAAGAGDEADLALEQAVPEDPRMRRSQPSGVTPIGGIAGGNVRLR